VIKNETEMLNHAAQNKPPQRTFLHYVFKKALEEVYALSDTLGAIQPANYEVEKEAIACLAFLIHEKIQDMRGLIEEMGEGKRSLGLN
jgi:hypothetical protein